MAERTMPSFTKSPPELVERFAAVLDGYPGRRPPEDVRLPGGVRRRQHGHRPLRAITGSSACPTAEIERGEGRRRRVVRADAGQADEGASSSIPAGDVGDDDARSGGWVERGLAHAASMPAKK